MLRLLHARRAPRTPRGSTNEQTFLMETIGLILFLLQQLGMTLGVGASAFALVFHLAAERDGTVEPAESSFLQITNTVLRTGLFFIIGSGLLITAAHVLAGEAAVVLEPAFVFKWLLIGIVLVNGLLMSLSVVPPSVGRPLAGGTWLALFLLHNLAPEAALPVLAMLYLGWLALFIGVFHGARLMLARPAASGTFATPRNIVPPTIPAIKLPPMTLPRTVSKPTLAAAASKPVIPAKPEQKSVPPPPPSIPKPLAALAVEPKPAQALSKLPVSSPLDAPKPAPIPLPTVEHRLAPAAPASFTPKSAVQMSSVRAPSPTLVIRPEQKPAASPALSFTKETDIPKPAVAAISKQFPTAPTATLLSKTAPFAGATELTIASKIDAPMPSNTQKPGLMSALRGLFTPEPKPVASPQRPPASAAAPKPIAVATQTAPTPASSSGIKPPLPSAAPHVSRVDMPKDMPKPPAPSTSMPKASPAPLFTQPTAPSVSSPVRPAASSAAFSQPAIPPQRPIPPGVIPTTPTRPPMTTMMPKQGTSASPAVQLRPMQSPQTSAFPTAAPQRDGPPANLPTGTVPILAQKQQEPRPQTPPAPPSPDRSRST